MKMSFQFSDLFGTKKSQFKKTVQLPKTAQDTIPFLEAYDNGLFLVEENKYTLIFAFENIDYLLLRDSEQTEKYNKYMNLLNSLQADVNYQEFILNTKIDVQTLKKAIIPPEKTNRFGKELYNDFCNVMNSYIEQAENGSTKQIMLVAMSYSPKSTLDNVNILFSYYTEMRKYFSKLKSDTRQLQPMEVFALLHKFYHQFDNTDFLLPKDFLSRGHRIKDYIAPSMFAFKAKEVEIGTAFTRIMYVKKFDKKIDDRFIYDLLDNNEKIAVSKQVRKINKSEALDRVRKKIFDVQGRIQKRKEKNYKSGTDFIPFRMKEKLEELETLQRQLAGNNCELFRIGIFVAVSAETKEHLEMLTQHIKSKAGDHQVVLDVLTRQQEKGLTTVLPFANNQFESNSNKICTHLLSDAAAVLLPFSTINHFSENGTCYGISTNSANMSLVVLDRTSEMNSNGFVLGTSGSGKSMFTKSEIQDIIMKHPDDEFIVIDPENEYKVICRELDGEMLKISPSSKTYFNVFDTDLSYTEDGVGAVAMKSQFLMTIVETAKGMALTSMEKSIIDRCVRLLYKQFISAGGDKEFLPTLKDFYNLLLKQSEQEATDIATTIELYATGSFDVFAHRTNVNINKQFLVIDIFEMGEQLRAVGLQVILEYLWQRVIENKKKGKRTWIWIDEFSFFFTDGEGKDTTRSGDFFVKVYKRIRKHGGTVTGITQNITEVLESKQAQKMLGNAEFVVLLQQKKEDLDAVVKLFNLSETQSEHLRTGEKGSGLIICGQKMIPFKKPIPKDSLMYKMYETSSLKDDENGDESDE